MRRVKPTVADLRADKGGPQKFLDALDGET